MNPNSPNPPAHPLSLIQQFCLASSTGDLERIKIRFAKMRSSAPDPPLNLNYPLEPLQPAIEAASRSGQAAIVSYLLDQGLYVDKMASLGLAGGHALADGSLFKNERLLKWFLTHGASPNSPADTGRTALDTAAWRALPMVFEQLLEHGGDIHRTNALHMAVRSEQKGSYEMVEYLLDAGADIDALEYAGTKRILTKASDGYGTALHFSAPKGRGDMVNLLLERGAKKDVRDTLNRMAAEVSEQTRYHELVPALLVK